MLIVSSPRLRTSFSFDTYLAHDRLMKSLPEELPPSTFKVGELIRALYSEALHEGLDAIDSAIPDAQMNFLPFSSTKVCLDTANLENLCYDLLRRTRSLQSAPQQRSYGQLLPFCAGSLQELWSKYIPERIPRALAQLDVRHADNRETHDPQLFQTPKIRILFLLFDPEVWIIYSKGYSSEAFGCMNAMDLGNHVRRFFGGAFENGWTMSFRYNLLIPTHDCCDAPWEVSEIDSPLLWHSLWERSFAWSVIYNARHRHHRSRRPHRCNYIIIDTTATVARTTRNRRRHHHHHRD